MYKVNKYLSIDSFSTYVEDFYKKKIWNFNQISIELHHEICTSRRLVGATE